MENNNMTMSKNGAKSYGENMLVLPTMGSSAPSLPSFRSYTLIIVLVADECLLLLAL